MKKKNMKSWIGMTMYSDGIYGALVKKPINLGIATLNDLTSSKCAYKNNFNSRHCVYNF